MRKWTTSACVVLAWCTLPLMAAAGLRVTGPAQAVTSTATSISTVTTSSTATTSTAAASVANSATRLALASYPAAAGPASVTRAATRHAAPARPPATWTVRPGDTLSGIAAALGVPGGWQALYAANRPAIGPDPGLIRAGTVLALPGPAAPARYAVEPGDTLSAIAAALGVKGGWSALYAANRTAIGPDPGLIRPGTVLTAPGQAATPAAPPHQAAAPHQAPPGGPPATARHRTAQPAAAPPGGRQPGPAPSTRPHPVRPQPARPNPARPRPGT